MTIRRENKGQGEIQEKKKRGRRGETGKRIASVSVTTCNVERRELKRGADANKSQGRKETKWKPMTTRNKGQTAFYCSHEKTFFVSKTKLQQRGAVY